jgi:threonine/homoserine/homoserine lactone efflux protein
VFSGEQLLGFVAATIICVVAPGPDNLSVLSLGLARGRFAGMGFALGCGLGCFTHTLWATLGVTAMLAASTIAFTIIKIAGAVYLFYLGIMALKSEGTKFDRSEFKQSKNIDDREFARFIIRGFIANAINPKVALFFLAFLPQFINTQGSISLQMAILGIIFSLISICLFSLLGYFSGAIGIWLRARADLGKWLDRFAGGLFIGLSIHLILSRKPT